MADVLGVDTDRNRLKWSDGVSLAQNFRYKESSSTNHSSCS